MTKDIEIGDYITGLLDNKLEKKSDINHTHTEIGSINTEIQSINTEVENINIQIADINSSLSDCITDVSFEEGVLSFSFGKIEKQGE